MNALEISMKSQTAAQRYRREAEECELKAKRAVNWVDQEAWLRLAIDWKKLARAAEQTNGYRPATGPR
jgi:hypothetical protein